MESMISRAFRKGACECIDERVLVDIVHLPDLEGSKAKGVSPECH